MTSRYFIVTEGPTQVGDIIQYTNVLGGMSRFKVTRVTKTMSKCKRDGDGYEHTFTRDIAKDMAKPHVSWNKSTYVVYRLGVEV